MMKFYVIEEVLRTHEITKSALRREIRRGNIKALRDPKTHKLIIPESELSQLEKYRKSSCERVKYADYIQSESWRRVRRLALKRDGYVCQQCGTGKNLEVHHINYEHLGQEGELEDVITLCRKCHAKVHANDRHSVIKWCIDAVRRFKGND